MTFRFSKFSAPWKFKIKTLTIYHPKRKVVLQPSFYRGHLKLHNSGLLSQLLAPRELLLPFRWEYLGKWWHWGDGKSLSGDGKPIQMNLYISHCKGSKPIQWLMKVKIYRKKSNCFRLACQSWYDEQQSSCSPLQRSGMVCWGNMGACPYANASRKRCLTRADGHSSSGRGYPSDFHRFVPRCPVQGEIAPKAFKHLAPSKAFSSVSEGGDR